MHAALIDLVYLYLSKTSTSVQEQSITPAFHLPGIYFSHLEVVSIKWSNKSQTIDLKEYGCLIHFPPNVSMKEEFQLTVGVSLSGNFDLPKNTTLVSATYYIETSSELLKPIKIEIEHCVSTEHLNKLTFARADAGNKTPPYHFESLAEGAFTSGIHWGVIEVSTFSLITSICNETCPLIAYSGHVLSLNRSGGSYYIYDVLFLVVRKLRASEKVSIHIMPFPNQPWYIIDINYR